MKLAASKVDFRSGCEVGVTVVFVAPADVTTEGVGVGEEGRVVGLAVELVGTGVVGITGKERYSKLCKASRTGVSNVLLGAITY